MDSIIYQNLFECKDFSLNDSNIQGGVTLSQSVNSGESLTLGSCCATKAEFSLLDLEGRITELYGVEFLYTYLGKQIGYFTVDSAEHIKNVGWNVTAYDRMMKFDKIVDSFLNGLSESFTLRELFSGLCEFVGVPASATSFTNEELTFYKNFEGSDIKGRDILYWIAEAAGCFAIINSQGAAELKFYESPESAAEENTITNADYISYSVSDFSTPLVNKLQIRSSEDDIGMVVFDESLDEESEFNAYIIEGNPLFYSVSSDQNDNRETIEQAANAILNKIKAFTCRPFECEVYDCEKIPQVGSAVSVRSPEGEVFSSVVMSRTQSGMKISLSATGTAEANKLTSVNISIRQKNNKTNELKRTLDSTISTVAALNDSNNTLKTVIEQTNSSVVTYISKTAELQSAQNSLSERANSLENTVNSGVPKVVTTSVTIDENGITVGKDNSTMKTMTTPDSFKVLDKSNNERINVSPDGTKLQKTVIEDDLTVGAVKMIKRENIGIDFVYIGGND